MRIANRLAPLIRLLAKGLSRVGLAFWEFSQMASDLAQKLERDFFCKVCDNEGCAYCTPLNLSAEDIKKL